MTAHRDREGSRPAIEAPDAAYSSHRWISRQLVDWARDADKTLMEHGEVVGTAVYEQRYHARWRARRMINLMVELRMHHRWELREHSYRKDGGWGWSIEYVGGDR